MSREDIGDVLSASAAGRRSVDPALLDRIAQKIGSSLRPVRPLPPSWVLVSALAAVCAVLAAAGAARLGFYAVRRLGALELGAILSAVGILILLAALASVREMIPGSRLPVAPWVLLAAGSLSLIALFALLFHDYRTERFVHRGVSCLTAGLLLALLVALAAGLILRRGFAVNSVSAGLAQGTLAGLAGLCMLELHCPNFQAFHVMLWHTAVVVLSGGAGALLAWIAGRLRRRLVRRP